MNTVSNSIADPALAVPRQAERARRISRLVMNPPGFAWLWIYFAIRPARRVFGFGIVFTVVAHVVCLAAAVLVAVAGRRWRYVGLDRARPRSLWEFLLAAFRAWIPFWAILGLGFVSLILGTRVLVGLFPVPVFLFAGFLWWQNRWWPRMVLMFGCAAIANVIDQCELHKLLREADREADGEPV